MLAGAGPAYPAALVDGVGEAEGVAALVSGGAGDPEFGGDLRHGVRAFAVVVGLVVHLWARVTWRGPSLGFWPPVRPRARASASYTEIGDLTCAQYPHRTASNTAVATHTTSANPSNPGTRTGNEAAAVATIPVPMIDANQFGPR